MKIVFGVFLALSVLFLPFSNTVLAQANIEEESIVVSDATPSANYALPYPGILPDNPLYFLKVARDRIISFLINDTLKKSEFNLLTSDKRFYSGHLLLEKGKQDLAITTLSKSNNYLSESIRYAKTAATQGKNIDTVLSNLKNSIVKREELFMEFDKEVDDALRDRLTVERERLVDFKNTVSELSSE